MHRPMKYDPAAADRYMSSVVRRETFYNDNHNDDYSAEPPSAPRFGTATKIQQMRDLGFDESHQQAEILEKHKELTDEVDKAHAQVRDLQAALQAATSTETLNAQKLAAVQQMNRSQCALMRAELQKCRRRLVHTQSVCGRLKEQIEHYLSSCPTMTLPAHLAVFPTEDEATQEEGRDLELAQQRWEKDVAQLQSDIEQAVHGSDPSKDLKVAVQRVADLDAELKKTKEDSDQQRREIEQLRELRNVHAEQLSAQSGTTGTPSSGDAATLRQELAAAEEKSKDQMKKMKQLATAYKKLDQEKNSLEAKLKDAAQHQDAAANAPKNTVSVEVLAKVTAALSQTQQELKALKNFVQVDFKRQVPATLEEVVRGQIPALEKMIEAGCSEWREKYAAESRQRRKLHNIVQELKGNIRVYCRVRPLGSHEGGSCISFPSSDEIQIRHEALGKKQTFQFNEVFQESSTQEDVFAAIRDLVCSMLDGYSVCIFAYGQTGAGKTHSMQGTVEDPGIYRRTFLELFKVAKERLGWTVELKGALTEIYNNELFDLLLPEGAEKKKLDVHKNKDGTNYVPNLTYMPVRNAEEVESLMAMGQKNRTVAATDMNMHSSRSHLLVSIRGNIVNSDGKSFTSEITLVDLAGSERMTKSGVAGDRAKEAIEINKSLSCLGDVIQARATKSAHIPFRNSKLTHVLQDSLNGDSKTLMILQINPCAAHVEESICSLQFGARVNNVELGPAKK